MTDLLNGKNMKYAAWRTEYQYVFILQPTYFSDGPSCKLNLIMGHWDDLKTHIVSLILIIPSSCLSLDGLSVLSDYPYLKSNSSNDALLQWSVAFLAAFF